MINHHNFKRSENFPHFYHFAVGVVKHGYRSLALEIIHTLAPARCQPAAAERRPSPPLPGWWNQFLMPLSLLTDARGEKRSEVESSPRTTRYAPGMEMSPSDQFVFHAVGVHSVAPRALFSPWCFCFRSSSSSGQQVSGGWNINICHFV